MVLTFCFAEEAEASEANYPLLLTQSLKDQYNDQQSIREQKREKRENLLIFYCFNSLNGKFNFTKEATIKYMQGDCIKPQRR